MPLDEIEFELNNELSAISNQDQRLLHVRPYQLNGKDCLFILHADERR